ncbi:hypothetical protein KY348_00455 [Candidatus Woesearchaeota archaeon]|nr:hypothetical protein [Candidatus Woesearchaeota archaeon]
MNKKAIVFDKLMTAVLIIIVLAVFIFFLVKIKIHALKIVEDSECKASIISHATLLRVTGEDTTPDIHCPTKYYTLPKESNEEIKHYIADSLKTCWGTWGKGELQLFNQQGYYCHVCSVIDFDDKTKKIQGLNNYLINTPTDKDTPLTYMDYLTGYASEKADPALIQEVQEKGFSDTIHTSKPYAVMFVYAKGKTGVKAFLDGMDALGLGTTGGGITTGLALGSAAGIGLAAAGVASGGAAIVIAGAVTAAGGVIGYITADDTHWIALTLFTEYNAETLKSIGCEIAPAKQDRKTDETG